MTEVTILLDGVLPEPPVIICKDEAASFMLQVHLHHEWDRRPKVVIADNWPEDWHVNAVTILPIKVLGTEAMTSFGIVGDQPISNSAREVLNAYIRLGRLNPGPKVSYRDLEKATELNRRTIQKLVRELAEAGIGMYRYGEGFRLDIGTWRVDANKAKALGIEIEEYRV